MRGARRKRSRAAGAIRVVRDAEAVFGEAILAGVSPAGRPACNRAGHDMCLFHDEDGIAWFKRRETGGHVAVTARWRAAGEAL